MSLEHTAVGLQTLRIAEKKKEEKKDRANVAAGLPHLRILVLLLCLLYDRQML